MKVKKKRIVILKNPRLRKIRTELRNLLCEAFSQKYSGYFDQIDIIRSNQNLSIADKERMCKKYYRESQKLKSAFLRSSTGCRVCGKRDVDLVYNPVLNTWFCEDCYAFNQKCQDELLPPGIYYP